MSDRIIKILIADSVGPTCDSICSFLTGDDSFQVVGRAVNADECLSLALIKRPDLIILPNDLKPTTGIEVCEQLALQNPNAATMLVLQQALDENMFRRMMLVGVGEFLITPLQKQRTLEAIHNVIEKKLAHRPAAVAGGEAEQRRKVISVIGPRGGCGQTTIAVNLACAIAVAGERADPKAKLVVLADINVRCADAGTFLDLAPHRTLADLAPSAHGVDRDVVETLTETHECGLHVVSAGAAEPYDRMELSRGTVISTLAVLRDEFPFTIVDMAEPGSEVTEATLDFSDLILLVVGMDLPRLQAARRYVQHLIEGNCPREKLLLVLNDFLPKSEVLTTEQAETILELPVALRIPYDGNLVSSAVNLGKPFVLSHPTKPVSRAIFSLVEKIGASTAKSGGGGGGSPFLKLRALFRPSASAESQRLIRTTSMPARPAVAPAKPAPAPAPAVSRPAPPPAPPTVARPAPPPSLRPVSAGMPTAVGARPVAVAPAAPKAASPAAAPAPDQPPASNVTPQTPSVPAPGAAIKTPTILAKAVVPQTSATPAAPATPSPVRPPTVLAKAVVPKAPAPTRTDALPAPTGAVPTVPRPQSTIVFQPSSEPPPSVSSAPPPRRSGPVAPPTLPSSVPPKPAAAKPPAFKPAVPRAPASAAGKRNLLLIGVLVLLIAGAAGYFFFSQTSRPGMTEGLTWMEIPAGTFIYQEQSNESEPKKTNQYWISKYEVTIRQYKEFWEQVKIKSDHDYAHAQQPKEKNRAHTPKDWDQILEACTSGKPYLSQKITWDCPIFNVDFYDAYAFAKWADGRLPTEEEWEKAARGIYGRSYPWGNQLDPKLANTGEDNNTQKPGGVDGYYAWAPVAAHPGDNSPYSVRDMGGNVAEWTGSWVASKADPNRKSPVVRGGSWADKDPRVIQRRTDMAPTHVLPYVGFRIATDKEPAVVGK